MFRAGLYGATATYGVDGQVTGDPTRRAGQSSRSCYRSGHRSVESGNCRIILPILHHASDMPNTGRSRLNRPSNCSLPYQHRRWRSQVRQSTKYKVAGKAQELTGKIMESVCTEETDENSEARFGTKWARLAQRNEVMQPNDNSKKRPLLTEEQLRVISRGILRHKKGTPREEFEKLFQKPAAEVLAN